MGLPVDQEARRQAARLAGRASAYSQVVEMFDEYAQLVVMLLADNARLRRELDAALKEIGQISGKHEDRLTQEGPRQ